MDDSQEDTVCRSHIGRPLLTGTEADAYVYFDLSKVNPAKPMVMNAYDEYGGTRQFVLNLATMN